MAKARIVYVVDDKQLKELQKDLNQIKKKNKEVASGFGDSEKEIKKTKGSLVDLKGIIGGLGLAALATGAIVAFANLTKEINKNRKETALLIKETGAGLDAIVAKVRATSSVFDKDYNEVLRAANAVSQQLGISMTESMDEINEAMSRGLDINGEYLETISEYSPFMKQAGIDFRQFNVLIQKQVTEGIFSDKGIDAIKEAVISIQEMTPATSDAIKAIGLSADQITKDIQSGATSYFEVIQEIGVKTREALDPRIKGQVLADIFRGAGEDAGDYALTLDGVGTSFKDVNEEQQNYIDKQLELLTATEATEKALISLTSSTQGLGISTAILWEKIKAATLRGVEETINLFRSYEAQFETFRASLEGASKDTLVSVFDELIKRNKELNEELKKTDDVLINKITFDELALLDQKIQLVNKQITDLNIAEIDEAKAALIAAEAANVLTESKERQAIATVKAEKAAKEEAIELEKSAERAKRLKEIESGEGIQRKDPFEDKKSEFLKEAEAKAEANERIKKQEQKLQDDILEIKEEAREKDKEAEDLKIEEGEERTELRQQLAFDALIAIADIQRQFANRRIEQINVELSALELSRNRELELAEGNAQKEAEINAKFDAQKKALQKKQFAIEQKAALFSIQVQTAISIAKTAGQLGFPAAIPFIVLAAALGVAQSAFVLAQKPPEFAEGVLRFRGKGTRKSDSNLVKISDEETILSAQTTDDYYPAIKAIYNREISPDVLNNLVMHRDTQPNITINDYDKLAQAVMRQPQNSMHFDESGFTQYLVKKGISIQKKQAKYKM